MDKIILIPGYDNIKPYWMPVTEVMHHVDEDTGEVVETRSEARLGHIETFYDGWYSKTKYKINLLDRTIFKYKSSGLVLHVIYKQMESRFSVDLNEEVQQFMECFSLKTKPATLIVIDNDCELRNYFDIIIREMLNEYHL